MGFEKYTLVNMRLFDTSTNNFVIISATFPPGPDANGMHIPSESMERIGIILQELDSADSATAITDYVRSRADPQYTMQSATYTMEMALRAYRSAGSGLRPGSSRMQSTTVTTTSSSNVTGGRHQLRRSSDDSNDDRKPSVTNSSDEEDSKHQ